jgi:type I restriction enzyme M protein
VARPRKKTAEVVQPSLPLKPSHPKSAFRVIRNYLAGQFVGATRDDTLLEEVLKCLFCKLLLERGDLPPLDYRASDFDLADQVRDTFTRVRDTFPDIYSSKTEILLDPRALRYVLQEINFSIMDAESDPIGDAFEVFIGNGSRGDSGQFFTPRSVTKLLVEALDPKPWETILDPACGAGGFLVSAVAYLQKRGAPSTDVAKNLFGVDKDSYLAKLAKAHIALLTGELPNIINGDSISLTNGKGSLRAQLPAGGADVLLTNPPFGVRIVAATPEILQGFELAHRWRPSQIDGSLMPTDVVVSNVPPQVLFVERCLSLLKPGGRLGIVLPESILSNKSYRHVVEYLTCHTDLHAVLGMPEALFKTSGKGGTHTKTCLLIATKRETNRIRTTKSIFMAEARWCGQDSRARIIPHNDLPIISDNYIRYRDTENITAPGSLGFLVDKDFLKAGVLCPRYYDPQAIQELIGIESTHNLVTIGKLVELGVLEISTGDEIGKLSYGSGRIPFIRTSDISNWEIKADPKHGVSEDIYEAFRLKQDVRTNDILMVKDGTYLIGTCAIITDADNQMIYQSHLYKIRVKPNQQGINPYLLLALLSSTIVQKQIRSKQFTQDIIDSLGARIHELVLPIPKSIQCKSEISALVQAAVSKRMEARRLVQQVHDLVSDRTCA